jgi:hypothetical protein
MASDGAQRCDRRPVAGCKRYNCERVAEARLGSDTLGYLDGICAGRGKPRECLRPVDGADDRCLLGEAVADDVAAGLCEQMSE